MAQLASAQLPMSRKKTGKGRPRKNGPPKYGEGQAAKKRRSRAIDRLRNNPDSLRTYHLTDLINHREKMQRLFDEKGNKHRIRALKRLDEEIKEMRDFFMGKKAKNEAKRNTSKSKQPKAVKAAEKYAEVLAKLKAGEIVEGFTLLPKGKAKANQTVEHLFDLDDGLALCKYND